MFVEIFVKRNFVKLISIILCIMLMFTILSGCSKASSEEKAKKDEMQNEKTSEQPKSFLPSNVVKAYAGSGVSYVIDGKGKLFQIGNKDNNKTAKIDAPLVILDNVESISSGGSNILAVKKDATLWGWGKNSVGQIDGTKEEVKEPKKIMDDVMQAVLGGDFSLVLKKDGTLWFWGSRRFGLIKEKELTEILTPQKLMDNVKKIDAGSSFALALTNDNTLWGFGSNNCGQLLTFYDIEDNDYKVQSTPVKLMDNITDFAAGSRHVLAMDSTGTVYGFGNNMFGALGDDWETEGKYIYYPTEATVMIVDKPISILTEVSAVAASEDFSAAIKQDGSLWLWGGNSSAQIGDGTTRTAPVPKNILNDVSQISLGGGHCIAIQKDNSIWSWGSNGYGELGNGYRSYIYDPVKIMDDVKQVTLSSKHALAVKKDGNLYGFGDNSFNQLGNNTMQNAPSPVKLMDKVLQAAAGPAFSLCILDDGTLMSWGNNTSGQLGNGKDEDIYESYAIWDKAPVVSKNGKKVYRADAAIYEPEAIMNDVESIKVKETTVFAVKKDGTLLGWGWNEFGQLGDGTKKSTAVPKRILEGVKSAAPYTVAVMKDKTVYKWLNDINGKREYLPSPVAIDNVEAAEAGDRYQFAIKEDGTLWAWGYIDYKLKEKNSSSEEVIIPTQIGKDIKAISVNPNRILLIGKDGTLRAVGFGSISGFTSGYPKAITEGMLTDHGEEYIMMEDVSEIALHGSTLLIVKNDGSLWGVGDNSYGQLGDGKRIFEPQKISD